MARIQIVYFWVGILIAILGMLSGYALFFRAVTTTTMSSEGINNATLWWLFFLGIIGGLVLLYLGLE